MRQLLFPALLFALACGHLPLKAPAGSVLLPRDEAAHPEAQTEWWYFLADLVTPRGDHDDVLFSVTHHRTRRTASSTCRSGEPGDDR